MKKRDLVIFFSIVLIIYSAANIFLYFKGLIAFEGIAGRTLYNIIFIFMALSFVAGKILERVSSSLVADILNVTGGFWLAFILYSTLIILVADLVILLTGLAATDPGPGFRQISYLLSFSLSALFVAAGFLNTVSPAIRSYHINLDSKARTPGIRIAAVSDVHLGSVVRRNSLRALSRRLEKISPDMILFLGDLIDGEIGPVIRDDLLDSLKIPEGVKYVFAITGNHEYIGGHSKTISYIESKGIRVLRDELISLEEGIQLAGRKDRDSERFTGSARKSLEELLGGSDTGRPLIILDHQPPYNSDKENAEGDIVLSGHTHRGQMWPLNYLTGSIYKVSYGHKKIKNTHYIVSSGYGTWGPRVRLGSRSELLDIRISFNSASSD